MGLFFLRSKLNKSTNICSSIIRAGLLILHSLFWWGAPKIFSSMAISADFHSQRTPTKSLKEKTTPYFFKICMSGNSKGYHLFHIISAWSFWKACRTYMIHSRCKTRQNIPFLLYKRTRVNWGWKWPWSLQWSTPLEHGSQSNIQALNRSHAGEEKQECDITLGNHLWALGKGSCDLASKANRDSNQNEAEEKAK